MPLCQEVAQKLPVTYWLYKEKACEKFVTLCGDTLSCNPYDYEPTNDESELKEFWLKSLVYVALGSEAMDTGCYKGVYRKGDPLAAFTGEVYGNNIGKNIITDLKSQYNAIAISLQTQLNDILKRRDINLNVKVKVTNEGFEMYKININFDNLASFSLNAETGEGVNFEWI